jgi:hypothetical protein
VDTMGQRDNRRDLEHGRVFRPEQFLQAGHLIHREPRVRLSACSLLPRSLRLGQFFFWDAGVELSTRATTAGWGSVPGTGFRLRSANVNFRRCKSLTAFLLPSGRAMPNRLQRLDRAGFGQTFRIPVRDCLGAAPVNVQSAVHKVLPALIIPCNVMK